MLVRLGSPRVLARRAALGTLAVSVGVVGLPAAFAQAAVPTTPFISEIHYDDSTEAGDTGEFVEVQFPAGTTDVSAWTVVLYNGSNNGPYRTTALTTITPEGVAVVDYATNGIQNGAPDGVALVGPTGVVDFVSYEGTMTGASGPAAGRTSTDIGVAESNSTPAGYSVSAVYDEESGSVVWYPPAKASKGAVNTAPDPDPDPTGRCDLTPTHEIGEVQGSGSGTPVAGQTVTVSGVVVGDLPGYAGFFVQDPAGDGDPATSDGIFVFSPSARVDLGDSVTLTGRASERFAQTQISAGDNVGVCEEGTAADLPAPALLDLPATDPEREPFEGMLVAPADTLTVSEVFSLTDFGELTLSEAGPLVQPTELARPGPTAEAIAAENVERAILLDDGLEARVTVTTRPYLSPTTPVRVGDELTFTEPLVLGYGFGAWRLQPADGTAAGVFAGQNTRPASPDEVGGDVQIGAFNVLNYFLTFGDSDVARGAETAEDFEKQADKIVTAIEALGADVVTLMEIEDTDSTGYSVGNADKALEDLVRRLDDAAGYDKWSFVPLPDELYTVDRDVIRNGIIYQNDVVQPIGDPVGLADEDVWSNAREPIAQTFVKDGDAFTVVANHFKSKRDTDATGDNVDVGDGQGGYNGDRTRQAESLVAFADELRAATGDVDVLLMGDFNAYTQEDPMQVFYAADYTDLGSELDPERYSYVFNDMSGSLDHAIATAALTDKVTDVAHWNINSVESFAYQYNGDPALYAVNPYRSSDHNPIVLGIDLEERCQGLLPTITGDNGNDVLVGTNGVDVIMGLGGNDTITGLNGNDVICGGAGDDTISGGNGDDVLSGGFGVDTLDGGNGSDTLIGGPGEDDVLNQGRGAGSSEQDGVES